MPKMISYKELFTFIGKFIRRQKGLFFCIFLLDALAWPSEALGIPYVLRLIIDAFIQFEGHRGGAWEALQRPIIMGVSIVAFVEIASRTMGFLLGKAIPKLQADIRMEMFDHISHHSPHYFNERFAGNLANKITDMTTQVELLIQQLFWPIVPALVGSLAAIILLWSINTFFACILLSWLVIHLAITIKFTKQVDAHEQRHGEARSSLLGKVVDSFTNNFAVNLFYGFNKERETISHFQVIEETTNVKARQYVEKMCCFTSLTYFLGSFIGINALLIYLWVHHQITTGQVVQIFNTVITINWVMWVVGRTLPAFFQSCGNAKQAYAVMCDLQDLGDQPNAPDLTVSEGSIVFDNVTFHYENKKLFENKHVIIKGGEKVGLVGYSGAGKSTFVSLILRLFSLHSGKIFIDGQEIAYVTLESLRRQVALIPQDPILFHRTLKENIAYGKPSATDDEIFHAAKLAHCHEFIEKIPRGFEARVGERGTKLSGGEKQRIAIARAILKDAPILILDEATSSLDSLTEQYIQESLEKLMQNRTTIVIAHRLSTLSRMDRLLVFDQGRIVEEGTHETLLNQDGLYTKMWKMQVGGFLPETP